MLAGVLGIIAFVLVLCVAGAIMDHDSRGVLKWGAALAAVTIAILVFTKPLPYSSATNCFIDWDARSNPEVCD